MVAIRSLIAKLSLVVLVLATAAAALTFTEDSKNVQAAVGQLGVDQVTLNPGGGIETSGSDGLRFTINSQSGDGGYNSAQDGQDGVVYRATRQYCCSAGGPMLNIGGTLYGQNGPAQSAANWTSLEILSTSGAVSVGARTSTTGSANATVRYTALHNSLTYTVTRTVAYTYPNDFVTDTYTFTIPEGNAQQVKFYLGGDTAPGSVDQGYGIVLTSPVRSIISLNTISQIMFGFREVPGSKPFDGATSQHYSTPYSTVQNGGDIGFVETASNHDAGLMMQWNLGSTPGTQTASFQQFATRQGTNLNATFSAEQTKPGIPVQLDISVANTVLATVDGIGFTIALPNNLVIGSAAPTSTCGGTLTATAGGTQVTLENGEAGSGANCVISVPVVSNVLGTYVLSADSVSGLEVVTNNVGTSSLQVTNDSDSDGVDDSVEDAAPNGGDGNNDGTPDSGQLHVTSLVNPVTNTYSTLVADEACSLVDVGIKQSDEVGTDDGYSYPLGLFDFSADCGTPGFTTTVTQYFYGAPTEDFVLRKFIGGTYQTVPEADITIETFGEDVLAVSYQITDGGELDADGAEDGVIVDPAGPAVLAAIPTSTPSSDPAPAVAAPNTGLRSTNMVVFFAALFVGLCLTVVQPAIRRRLRNAFSKEKA